MPQLPCVTLPNGVVVYIWHITEPQERLQQRYEEWLTAQHLAASNQQQGLTVGNSAKSLLTATNSEATWLTVTSGHKHFLASRILLHEVFGQHRIGRDLEGKPYLESITQADLHTADTHINYSHADDWVVLACHPMHKVGIDIESPRAQLHRIYKRFCSPKEMQWMGENPSTLLLQKAWCAKEALYKAIGKKGTDFREQLHLQPIQETDTTQLAEIYTKSTISSDISEITNSNSNAMQTATVHFFQLNSMVVATVLLEE